MEPITREEYYLAKIAGTYEGKTPAPVTIEEYYLATMAGDYSGNTPQPVTRLQYYMAKVAGVWGGSIPAPVTRLEYYWAAIASGEGKVFPPVTREEHFLVLVADAYSVVLTVVTGKPSPSQEYPQEIESVGQDGEIEVKTLGANLFDASTALKTQIDAGLLHINDSGEVVLNGTFGTNNRNFYITLKPGVYCLTGGAIWHIIASKDSVFDRILTIDEETTYHCYISNGTYNEVVSNPMINAGSTALPYEPYKPAQALIIPTPNGLPGIPVSSGGNYTDADGQQWVCDEVDFKKGVYVQRVATETPKAKWKNFEETADVPNRYRISGALVNRYRDGSSKCLISHGIYTNCGIAPGWALNSTTFYYHPKEDVTKEEAKEQILGFINSANPLTFLGQLETPIEKPLTTEQLATYKALRTYSPTTTVANDAEAGMSVGYAKMK